MTKRLVAIYLVLVVLLGVFVPSCEGGGGEQCSIVVKATLDGSAWTGAVQYTLTGPTGASPITGTAVENSFTVDCGSWTCAYVSGGPGVFVNITPSPTQSVASGTITFTLNFKREEERQCTIEVKATLCDDPWTGAVQYTLTGPGAAAPITGTEVSKNFTVDCGSWTCAYVSGGPAGAYLVDITPSATQSVSGGGTITFTLNFELNQDAGIQFLTWTKNGQSVGGTQEAYVCDFIDSHFKQWVDGCEGYQVAMNETSELYIHWKAYNGNHPGAAGVVIWVIDDWDAVNKIPTPIKKVSQVPSIDGMPVPKYYWREHPGMCQNITLDVETSWQLVKGTNYMKSINWFGISQAPFQSGMEHPDVLFELVLQAPGTYVFDLTCSAKVKLLHYMDNPINNSSTSNTITLIVNWPEPQ